MRVSAIADWTTCEAMALTDPSPEARVHVAAWVGTLAHAALLDTEVESPPPRLRFDGTTRTAHQADVQALAIAREAKWVLDTKGWSIMESEREVTGGDSIGHLDILAWHKATSEIAVVDLKTGQGIGAGWLQVGGYLQLLGNAGIDAGCGGILHVPRVAVSKEPQATLDMRDAGALEAAWLTAKSRIDAVLAGATALRSPGLHCGRCAASCPVRA